MASRRGATVKVGEVERLVEQAVTRAMERAIGPISERAADLAAHQLKVVLERMELQHAATLDALEARTAQLDRKIEELRRELTLRIEALEAAVRMLFDAVRKNSEDIAAMGQEIAQVREDLRTKADRDQLARA